MLQPDRRHAQFITRGSLGTAGARSQGRARRAFHRCDVRVLGLSVLAYFLEDLGGSVLELGSLFATFAIFNIAASTWSGYASDKLGRRPVLVVSTFGVSVGFLLTGTAQSVPWLFVARAWLGFWSGVASVGRAYIADVTSPSHRTDTMGKAGAVMMVGYAVGAPLGGTCMLDLRPSPACRPQP